MAKIKDKIEEQKLFADKELESIEPGYKYKDEKGEHAHFLDGVPLFGTSTITGVLNKPLAYWASGLACEKFGWINKKDEDGKFRTKEQRLEVSEDKRDIISKLPSEDYLKLLDDAYSAHATSLKTSASDGTDLHALLEDYVKQCIEKNNGAPLAYGGNNAKVLLFAQWSVENVKRFIWSEMNCYSKEYHLGGITDCGFEDKEGRYGIIDFKSAKVAYDSHFIQIGGYDIQVSENGGFTANGVKTFTLDKPIEYYVVFPFGIKNMIPQYRYNVKQLKEAFIHCLELHKLINVK